jgi:hypothetical protein
MNMRQLKRAKVRSLNRRWIAIVNGERQRLWINPARPARSRPRPIYRAYKELFSVRIKAGLPVDETVQIEVRKG